MCDVEALLGGGLAGDLGKFGEGTVDFGEEEIGGDFAKSDELGDEALFLFEKREEQVFDIDGLVVETGCLLLGLAEGVLGAFGKFVEVHRN